MAGFRLRSRMSDLTSYLIYLIFVSTIGPLQFGYHLVSFLFFIHSPRLTVFQAELNAPQDVLTCVKRSIRLTPNEARLPQCIPMDSIQLGLVSSMFTLGGLVGALAAGPVSARYGRLKPMRVLTAFFTLGPIAEALAPNVGTMAAGRFISGLGAGATLVVVPIYISEIAPPAAKGFFGAFTQIMTNTGIFVAQFLGYFLSHDQMWRVILAAAGAFGILQLAGLTFAVDSPKWEAEQGRMTLAKRDLRRIRGNVDIQKEVDGWGFDHDGDGEGTSCPPQADAFR